METSLKTGFAQIFPRCPKNLSCPKFGGTAAPLAPTARTPMRGDYYASPVKPPRRWSSPIHNFLLYLVFLSRKHSLKSRDLFIVEMHIAFPSPCFWPFFPTAEPGPKLLQG